MISAPAILQEPHHQALELLSARALASGDVASAFAFADRRCRIPPLAEPHCFVLRADALYRMGEKELALLDIARAIEIAPDEIAPNRRLLAWAEGNKRRDAALRLIARDRDPDSLRNAMSILREGGRRAFASARLVSDTIRGWAAWPLTGFLEIIVADGANSVTNELEEHPTHPLANVVGCAADFVLPLPVSDVAQLITVSCDGETLLSISHAGVDAGPRQCGPHDRLPGPGSYGAPEATAAGAATVIVPIYADFAATRACVESLLAQMPERSRVMLVNDASPDEDIHKYLVNLRSDERVDILTNERNLGFVGAVNRALSEVRHGDIVLLNADTIVPLGFVDRLAAVAHSSPQIGTVTPLSNNGEFTSFPVPNTQNPLPSLADIIAIDRVAARVNADRIVDIPNGIGFCLFVTRACLDAIGFLSNRYDRGYLEDVDFCLRARERGFRNVCAPSIYVGHAGSRSFGSEKRSLVVRNLAVAERRFPTYRSECAAFVTLDPLRASRQAIERAMPSCDREPLLLLTGEGAVAAAAHERARQIEASGRRALVLTIRRTSGGGIAKLTDASGAAPQSMAFELDVADDVAALMAYLRATRPVRMEIADPAAIPRALLDELLPLGVPYDVLIADAGLLGDERAPHRAGRARARRHRSIDADRPFTLRELMAGADRLLAPCDHAQAFVGRWFPDGAAARVQRLYSHAGPAPEPDLRPSDGSRHRLGIIPIESALDEQQFIRDLAAGLRTTCPGHAIVVMGDTPDGLALMQIGNTLVTGSTGVGELADACRAHGVGALLPCATRPLFGHPLQSFALSGGLPIAYFDWSGGGHRARHGDLLLNPSAPTGELVAALVAWQGAH